MIFPPQGVTVSNIKVSDISDFNLYKSYPSYINKSFLGMFHSRTKGIIALETDDAELKTYTEAYPDCRSRGLPFSIAVPYTEIGKETHCTWAQLEEMHGNGTEIALHGINFENFTDASVNIIIERKLTIERNYHIPIHSIVDTGYPDISNFMLLDSKFGQVLMQYFDRFNVSTEESIGNGIFDTRIQLDLNTVDFNKKIIDHVAKSGAVATLYWHPHKVGTVDHLSLTGIREILDYIQTKRTNGEIDVVTPTTSRYAIANPENSHLNSFPSFNNVDLIADGMYSRWGQGSGTVTIDNTTGYSDSYCMRISATPGRAQCKVNWNPQIDHLMMRFWAKCATVGQSVDIWAYGAFNGTYPNWGSAISGRIVGSELTIPDTWTEYYVPLGAPLNTRGTLYVNISNRGSYDLLIDDIFIYPI